MTKIIKKAEQIARSHGAKELRIIFTEVRNTELRDSPQWAAKYGFLCKNLLRQLVTIIWSKTLK